MSDDDRPTAAALTAEQQAEVRAIAQELVADLASRVAELERTGRRSRMAARLVDEHATVAVTELGPGRTPEPDKKRKKRKKKGKKKD